MSTFNELIDFTRFTTGTYLDSVVYGDELVTNGTFDNNIDGWTAYNAVISYDNGKIKVDDSANAGSDSQAYQDITTVAGKTYKLTFDKISTTSVFWFAVGASPAYQSIYYSGSLGTQTGQQVLFFKATSALTRIALISSSTGITVYDNCSVKEVIGGQVSGTPLLRTAAINEPRLEYDASGNPLGLLIEEVRTNVLAYSEGFTTGWGTFNIVTTPNIIASPDGAVSGARLQEDSSGTGGPRRFPNDTAVLTANQAQTLSCFFKAGTSAYAYLTIRHSNGSVAGVEFDVTSGTVNSTAVYGYMTLNSSDITSAGNGWYRCSVTATSSASTSNGRYFLAMTDGSGLESTGYPNYALTGKNIYAWGAQVETGAFPTSYIPTSGSTVTRTKDLALLPVERFAYSQAQGSIVFYADVFSQGQDTTPRLYEFSDGSNNNAIRLYNPPVVDRLTADVRSGGVSVFADNLVSPDFNEPFKIFQAYKVNDFSVGFNGKLEQNDTSGAVPIGIAKINLFSKHSGSNVNNGHIKSIQYYPKRLSNEELELLTQPSASPTMNLTFDGQATSTLVEGFHD